MPSLQPIAREDEAGGARLWLITCQGRPIRGLPPPGLGRS